ncbi:Dihydrolipoyllysine-residue succinyltransferase component of 2-oxoglutarate dehydrogenase complex [Candidatus Cyrtobacter comes]|uniref:Dihydrolipoyllysine-residue succinyltransferase component of 2-oxoglutarate dehydrogenase complex n=1 Tax=Candidatus Cyrtobacter comes TaxID=675776 RepID=A0ABU5L6Z1_9RICK|nr:Dihydrolipoyllysine-residue succinyltransferase component of 2-oxoglutarate dehydrogenase complex [Candidatus Cyrtobacter comes]
MVEVVVPALGESISEATIAKWYKLPGDIVNEGEVVAALETDKITLEVPANASGILQAILKKEGDVVIIGELIAKISEGAVKQEEVVAKPIVEVQSTLISKNAAPIAFPAATKLAKEAGIDIASIKGSGKGERVTKYDVASSLSDKVDLLDLPGNKQERVKMTKLRQTIAKRLKDSQNTAAILTTFNEVDMSYVMMLRKKYQEKFTERYGIKLGFMSFFVKAVVAALKEIPAVNAEIDNDYIVYKYHYDIGVAVGTDHGLVVPIVKNADLLSFSDIEKEIALLGKKAKDGKLSIADMSGGTFSITNGGIYGSMLSTPIINPPQSAILGMHNIVERPIVVGGEVVIRPIMYIALSYDHRIIDGKEAVTFLRRIKEMVEAPERILIDM